MNPYTGIDGVEVWPLGGAVRVRLTRDPVPAEAAPGTEAHREWERLRTIMPRLYNGPMLSVVSVDFETGEILARRENYQRLVIQPRVATGVRLLATTGVLTARDAAGRAHVLLGRRSPHTRIYGGMWELGPSGGLGVPPASVASIEPDQIAAHLADEVLEEVGLLITQARPVAIVRDLVARSDDIALVVDVGPLERAVAAPANWEYVETYWLPVDEAGVFEARHAGEIISQSRALFRVLGWV